MAPRITTTKEELLAMRAGKNKKSNPEAPANKLNELVAIQQSQGAMVNLSDTLQHLKQLLEQDAKKDERIAKLTDQLLETKDEVSDLNKKIGEKEGEATQYVARVQKLEEFILKKRKTWIGRLLWTLPLALAVGALLAQALSSRS